MDSKEIAEMIEKHETEYTADAPVREIENMLRAQVEREIENMLRAQVEREIENMLRAQVEERVTLAYGEDGAWRVNFRMMPHKSTIGVHNRMDPGMALTQIRGMVRRYAAELLTRAGFAPSSIPNFGEDEFLK